MSRKSPKRRLSNAKKIAIGLGAFGILGGITYALYRQNKSFRPFIPPVPVPVPVPSYITKIKDYYIPQDIEIVRNNLETALHIPDDIKVIYVKNAIELIGRIEYNVKIIKKYYPVIDYTDILQEFENKIKQLNLLSLEEIEIIKERGRNSSKQSIKQYDFGKKRKSKRKSKHKSKPKL